MTHWICFSVDQASLSMCGCSRLHRNTGLWNSPVLLDLPTCYAVCLRSHIATHTTHTEPWRFQHSLLSSSLVSSTVSHHAGFWIYTCDRIRWTESNKFDENTMNWKELLSSFRPLWWGEVVWCRRNTSGWGLRYLVSIFSVEYESRAESERPFGY